MLQRLRDYRIRLTVMPAPAGIAVAVTVLRTVLRTALEDAALRRELDGYADYARQVRHRLLPGRW